MARKSACDTFVVFWRFHHELHPFHVLVVILQGDGSKALQMHEDIRLEGIQPTGVTFLSLLHAATILLKTQGRTGKRVQ